MVGVRHRNVVPSRLTFKDGVLRSSKSKDVCSNIDE